jgi:hypothetical protein
MDDAQPSTSPDGSAQGIDQPARKKQKRNKPTLSCEECVERKTKVSAGCEGCDAMRWEVVAIFE